MTSNLVIVESPAKAKTIERYLGPGYTVLASYGHVRDLPENPGKGQLGVDVEHDFAPDYEIPADRRRQVSAIEKAGRGADRIFLATDLDREGEAIAWHVARGGPPRAGPHQPGHLQRDHGAGHPGGIRRTRGRSTSTSWMPSRRAASWTAWSATRSAR